MMHSFDELLLRVKKMVNENGQKFRQVEVLTRQACLARAAQDFSSVGVGMLDVCEWFTGRQIKQMCYEEAAYNFSHTPTVGESMADLLSSPLHRALEIMDSADERIFCGETLWDDEYIFLRGR